MWSISAIPAGASSPHHQQARVTSLKTPWYYTAELKMPGTLYEGKELILEMEVEQVGCLLSL